MTLIFTNLHKTIWSQVFLLILFVIPSTLLAQTTRVGGKVQDVNGHVIPYATVYFKDSSKGTLSDENGKFYMESKEIYSALVISFMGYKTIELELKSGNNLGLEVVLEEESASLDEVVIVSGKQPKKNNPAIDILRKIWEHKRQNGVKNFKQYEYDKYEKIEFDLNSIDSTLMESKFFEGLEFVFDMVDTSRVTGNSYLPIFINESYSKIYGDNKYNLEKEELEANKNSGFDNNQSLIAFIKDLYAEYDIYDNYIKLFEKSFTSPLSRTGIHVYNYALVDSAYRNNKWAYNIVYYPRRSNELTFRGDFWVNDTTWAVQEINMQASKSANINWIRDIYIEQEYEVLNDSVFLLKRDHFFSDFALREKEEATGMYGKRTTLYDNYVFDEEKDKKFYKKVRNQFDPAIYNRSTEYWADVRMESLNKDEVGVYQMLDTLKTIPKFNRMYDLAATLTSGYYQRGFLDYGPIFSILGYNEVEGWRTRLGARTFFDQNDMWRLEGFAAYGFRDQKFKYGLSAKVLLNRNYRIKAFGGHRSDVEQTGAQLTSTNDVLGRNLASSSLFSVGSNDRLTKIKLSNFGFEVEPWNNLVLRLTGSYRSLQSASESFSLDYYDEDGNVIGHIRQPEMEFAIQYTPGKKMSGYGVERLSVNDGKYPTFILNYSHGFKDFMNGAFSYNKVQALYHQPINIGGLGKFSSIIEAGTIFDPVPLGLLNPIPGNQSYFSIYNTFTQLDYYEFVSDTYTAWHVEHDFGGRLLSRIPLLRDLKLREIVGFRTVYGTISDENKALNASDLEYVAPEDIYWEWSAGVGNIFKVFRLDFNFRGNYLKDNPDARKFGVTGTFQFVF